MGHSAKNRMGAGGRIYQTIDVPERGRSETRNRIATPVRRNVTWHEYDISDILNATIRDLKV